MVTIANCQIVEEIYSSVNTVVYRGNRLQTQQPVILKLLHKEYPTHQEIAKFKQQYEIVKNLNISGVVKPYSCEHYQNSLVLVFEDFGGQSLYKVISYQQLEVVDFLCIAVQLAETIGQLHQLNIIHKDIKPQNIIINPETKQVKITDFSIASLLPQENPTINNANCLEGTLAYMSPEQTGRMNRSLDYRTDFYSLGISFYEMLTGQLPFNVTDSMELVHCHIAKQPVPLQQINPEIPKAVSDIVIKLLAKTAEERYQSAFGLKIDLEICLTQLQNNGKIANFSLCQQDFSSQLQIPQKLYGREKELAQLLACFDRVSEGETEMIMVAGYSGIGKSALVHEIHKPIVRQRGYFIDGKFDQYKRNIPYSSLIQAFQELVRQLLTESEAQIQIWKNQLIDALSANAQVIIDVIPELQLIIGKQPSVPQLEPTASQNRFNLVFQKFISVFTQKEHPLVLFLDDLQWADSASIKLLQVLTCEPDSQYLLTIGAYRDNEVDATHPLMQTLAEIQASGIEINKIVLQPLAIVHVNQLIADTLNCEFERTKTLAELLFNKTNGNPFFLNQLLKSLHQEKLLEFDYNKGSWQWNLELIHGLKLTDNVVELMVNKVQKLEEKTQNILKLAACIGNRFDIKVLSIVNEKSLSTTARELWQTLHTGLILPLSNDYKLSLMLDEEVGESGDSHQELGKIAYKFLHDRVQQAAYVLIPEDQKQEIHLKIGELLLQNTPPLEREEKIFSIVNQLNFGTELITEPAKRNRLVQLNLIAGRKAKAAAAYESAVNYLNIGLGFLATDSWLQSYELTLNLHEETAESLYLNTNFEQSERLVNIVLEQAHSLLDKVKVYELKIQFHIAKNQMLRAIDTALPVLEMLGVSLSAACEKHPLIVLPSLADLENIPEMTDPYKLAAMRLLTTITACALQAKPELLLPIILTEVKLCIEYGYSPLASLAYGWYGVLLCGTLGDIDSGYHSGQLGIRLLEKFNCIENKCTVYNLFNVVIRHWKEHSRETITPLKEAIQSGIETGSIEWVGYCASSYLFHLFLIGKPLHSILDDQISYISLIMKIKQEISLIYAQISRQLTLNLQGLAVDKILLIGESFDESIMLPRLHETKNSQMLFAAYFAKTFLNYLFKNYAAASEYAALASEYAQAAAGFLSISVHNYYYSLALLAQYDHADASEQQQILCKVEENQEKMQHWAYHAPLNCQHKYDLVEAEKARVLGQHWQSAQLYERAIKGARENKYLQEEALAYELATEFYLACGMEKIAPAYLKEAHYAYTRWGAKAKVEDLETRYPQLVIKLLTATDTINTPTVTNSKTTNGTELALDLATVIKASQAIGSEIVLEQLLSKLMQIIIENAGAQTGFLLLETNDQLLIEAEGAVDSDDVTVLQSIPIANHLPTSLINYVVRTCENIVLNDATAEGNFTNDPYIQQHQIKSILCVPLINQGKIISIVYLENNLTTGAFTPDRLEVIKILSAQAAISIENARLYQTLEDKVKERTIQLAQANQEITTLNELLKEENVRMSAELEVTKQLQQMVLPKQSELDAIIGLEIAAFMEPADEVGGDYYDVLQQDGKVKIGIGDVTGHGLESGILMLMTQTAVRTLQQSNQTDPVQFLDILNRTIHSNVQRINPYKNLTLAILDYADSILTLSGQHEEIIVVRYGGVIERIDTNELGFPIGLDDDISDLIATFQIQLNPGDAVVLYTDGVTEAFDINRKQYGLEKLCAVISCNWQLSAQELKQAVINDVRRHIGTQKVFDDITLVVLKQK